MNSTEKITANEFRLGHPVGLVCDTDIAYTKLANQILESLKASIPNTFLSDPAALKRIAVKMALFVEDIASDLFLWETFKSLYNEKFKKELPFYKVDKDDSQKYDVKLALWMFLSIEVKNAFIHPEFIHLEKMALEILQLISKFGEAHKELPANTKLNAALYNLDALKDITCVKRMVMWLQNSCYLGNWETVADVRPYMQALGIKDETLIRLAIAQDFAFTKRTWPLSMRAQDVYAEILRYATEDKNDEDAERIEEIEFREMELYRLTDNDEQTKKLTSFTGEEFVMDFTTLDPKGKKSPCNAIMTSIGFFNGVWHPIGLAHPTTVDDEQWNKYVEDQKKQSSMSGSADGKFDAIIKKHKGQRLFYMAGTDAYKDWIEKELGVKNPAVIGQLEAKLGKNKPFAIFLEDNGQTNFNLLPELINDKNNPFKKEDGENFTKLDFITRPQNCAPNLLKYLLEHKFLSQLSCYSANDGKQDNKIIQDNIEFIARFFRRDIDW